MIVARKSTIASLVFSATLIGALLFLAFPRILSWELAVGYAVWTGLIGGAGFLMLHTGRTSLWRATIFIVLAWAFVFYFKAFLLGLGQSRFFSPEIQEVPYCHIAMASSFLNTLYQQYLALQSGHWRLWGPLSFGALWLAVTLAIGQAWCSWGCFYGGLDEGFSRILRRPVFRRFRSPKRPATGRQTPAKTAGGRSPEVWRPSGDRLPPRWRDLPAAILLFTMLVSLGTMLPIFCLWLCPLKATTAFLDSDDPTRMVQIVLFSATGVAALVVLPLVLKKRVFCGLICPFGAWQAFFGRINPFRVTLSTEACTECRLCLQACPTFVLDEESLRTGMISSYCNRCGECIDRCAAGAITYTVLGRPLGASGARTFFIFAALLVTGSVGSLFVPPMIARLLEALWK